MGEEDLNINTDNVEESGDNASTPEVPMEDIAQKVITFVEQNEEKIDGAIEGVRDDTKTNSY